jgi:hypothetical protein
VTGEQEVQMTPITVPVNLFLEAPLLGANNLENTSDRECSMKTGEPRKDLAEASYQSASEFTDQQPRSS